MRYHIDDEKLSLADLRQRITETDLVPSRACLLDDIEVKFAALEQQGILTLAGLRSELKNAKRLQALANRTGIDQQYLVLLRREVESYFPQPFKLVDFDWLPAEEIVKLAGHSIRTTAELYETDANHLAQTAGVDQAVLAELVKLAGLTRVQWTNPTAARMLRKTGIESAEDLAAADADKLCETLRQINADGRFFKGNIGLRDVKRWVQSAGYVTGQGK
jgi:hypothetical protein